MAPRRRPTAYEVSFGEPLEDETEDSVGTSDTGRKRNRDGGGDVDHRGTKRRNLDAVPKPPRKYEPRTYEILETADMLIFGEELDVPDDGRKPLRVLSYFAFFDPLNENAMVSLDVLDDEGDNRDKQIQGAGFVFPRYANDEDEGQEDNLGEDEEPQYARIQRILRFFTNYQLADDPFYVESEHAIYELAIPSKKYRRQLRPFYALQKILKLVISSAANEPEKEFYAFVKEIVDVDVLGEKLTERELWDAVPKLRDTLETIPSPDPLRATPVISYLLSRAPPVIRRPTRVARARQLEDEGPESITYTGNLDLAVLKKQNTTHVTPRIAQMAIPLFREKLRVVGPRPPPEPEFPADELTLRVKGFIQRVSMRRRVQFDRINQRIGRSYWLKYIKIDNVRYNVGDTVVFVAGSTKLPKPQDVKPSDTLANYFWFAKIIRINEEHETVHVVWFEHSSRVYLQELGNPQELFLVNLCDEVPINMIIGVVEAHYLRPDQPSTTVKPQDFFYRYMWDDYLGVFRDIDMEALTAAASEPPPHNCHVCDISDQFDEDTQVTRIHRGVRWHKVDYHLDDYVLIKAEEGPCHIGQIRKFYHGSGLVDTDIVVRLFGRVDKLGVRPVTTVKDEKHLFRTDDEMTINITHLIAKCYVVLGDSLPYLDAWKAISPHHFYVTYHFPSLIVNNWEDRKQMGCREVIICGDCMRKNLKRFEEMNTFLAEQTPLRVLDPFGGTGAFGLAMEEMGCFKLTHAVEISPSAARTLQMNAPDATVYNQCSNLVLQHAILTHENKNPEPLKSIEGHPLPPPPKPGDIDCLIAGFPCQPHSRLNMYQKANDRKSNLILTALSYADFYRPLYCIFENVRGFLQFNLRARQSGKYAVKGGIPVGGLKFLAATLLELGYQIRCGLLQAAHYGTPQTRVRFFLIAAKRGLKLPELPQPTHDFPDADLLEIKFPDGITLEPIRAFPGIGQYPYVSAHDAISDLPEFHWKHPRKLVSRRVMEAEHIKECREDRPWCGISGADFAYEHEPQNSFQARCRTRPTADIQHYTRTYQAKKVERVVEIPLEAGADYRSLRSDLWEWQFANPASSIAKAGFRAGLYGRVQADGWFQTTVTNVDPTAKQSRVLHPYCKRIVTVRELARSQGFPDHFVFHAIDNRVVTMHRQIGNAVPWPVSVAIAREFRDTLFENWLKTRWERGQGGGGGGDEGNGDAMEID